MRPVLIVLIVFLLALQYQLWFARDGLVAAWHMRRAISEQKNQNDISTKSAAALANEIASLKKGGNAIENRARNDLGMVKKDEVFYQIVTKK